jgi:hypothetical protein
LLRVGLLPERVHVEGDRQEECDEQERAPRSPQTPKATESPPTTAINPLSGTVISGAGTPYMRA